jgi:hypothetical protein
MIPDLAWAILQYFDNDSQHVLVIPLGLLEQTLFALIDEFGILLSTKHIFTRPLQIF